MVYKYLRPQKYEKNIYLQNKTKKKNGETKKKMLHRFSLIIKIYYSITFVK